MKEGFQTTKLIFEEKKASILFLWLFNLMYYSFDIFYYWIRPKINKQVSIFDTDEVGLGVWLY
ncbi:two-component sensor histidine kinase, partial [Neobacillus drentensis]